MATSWLYMYEKINKVMSIRTPILNGSIGVLQPKGWHSVLLWSLGMPQSRYISIHAFLVAHKKDRVLWMKQTYGTSWYF
jgi:hypothetical protein